MTLPRIVGLGSHHGDDQAGWLVVDRLQELGYPTQQLCKAVHPVDLLAELTSASSLLICDACDGPGDAGTIHRWQWPSDALPTLRSGSTHDLPLAQVLGLAGQFATHPFCAEIWGVTGTRWIPASQPGRAVQVAAHEIAAEIRRRYRA